MRLGGLEPPLQPSPAPCPSHGTHLGRRGQRVVQAQTVLPRRAFAGARGRCREEGDRGKELSWSPGQFRPGRRPPFPAWVGAPAGRQAIGPRGREPLVAGRAAGRGVTAQRVTVENLQSLLLGRKAQDLLLKPLVSFCSACSLQRISTTANRGPERLSPRGLGRRGRRLGRGPGDQGAGAWPKGNRTET